MSIKLSNSIFHTKVDVLSNQIEKTDVGDFDLKENQIVYSEVPCVIRPKISDIVHEINGITHYQTHIAYLNEKHNGVALVIDTEYVIIDKETGLKYRIIGIEKFYPAKSRVVLNLHHYKLILEAFSSQHEVLNLESVSAKALIEKE